MKPSVSTEHLEAVIPEMLEPFTTVDFSEASCERFPRIWQEPAERYGLYGSGTRYSARTCLGNRLSPYSRRKALAKEGAL